MQKKNKQTNKQTETGHELVLYLGPFQITVKPRFTDTPFIRILFRPSSFFSPFSVVRPTQIFGIFKKERNDVVKPFFSRNNSFNLENEHSNSIEKNRNIFYSILCILLIQLYVNVNCQRHPWIRGPPIQRLSETEVFFFFFFQSDRPTQHQETHSTLNEKRGDSLMAPQCPHQRDLTVHLREQINCQLIMFPCCVYRKALLFLWWAVKREFDMI